MVVTVTATPKIELPKFLMTQLWSNCQMQSYKAPTTSRCPDNAEILWFFNEWSSFQFFLLKYADHVHFSIKLVAATDKSFSSGGHSMEPLHWQGAIKGSSFVTSKHETQGGRWARNVLLRGDGAFCMAFWMPFQKKTILQMIQNCGREVPTVFLFTNWWYVVGKKIIYTPQKLTWNLRRMISKRLLFLVVGTP